MKHENSAAILPTAMVLLAITASVVAMSVAITGHHSRQARRVTDRNTAIGYGDGVIENLFDQWRQAMSSVTNPKDRNEGLSTRSLSMRVTPPSAATLPPPGGISLASWSIYAADPFLQPVLNIDQRPVPENGTASRLRVRQHYLATIKVRFGNRPEDVANLQRVFVRAGRNLFDDFFFGVQPITEYAPGPEMYVDGTVYVGGDLYTPNDTLHFLQNVTFTGNHILDFRPNDPHRTAPTITGDGLDDNWSPSNPPRQGQEQKLFDTQINALDPNFLDDPIANDVDSDGNRNNDGYHEMIEPAVPGQDPLQLDASTSERLTSAADYRIFIDANNNVKIHIGASPAPLNGGPAHTALMNLVSTNQAIKDVREKDYVRVTTLDIDQIRVAFEQGVLKDSVGGGDGLLLYVADTSTGTPVSTQVMNSSTGASTAVSSARTRGVRLKNGGHLPTAGLSIVSPNTVYVQGDYNSGRANGAEPASNTATNYTPPNDRPSPYVTNYEHAPAAIIGDAVNILSNAWNDANSMLPQSSRRAINSTVNAAIVAGNVPTTTTSYSGGIENFVRFHENWSSRYFTVSGAFAQLYASEQARGLWKDADYTPPMRRWFYDDLLRDRNPPGMRPARAYARGAWTLR